MKGLVYLQPFVQNVCLYHLQCLQVVRLFFYEVNIYMKGGWGGIVLPRVVFIKFLKCQALVPG